MSLERWRLVLGESSEKALGVGLDGDLAACDAALAWLYGRENDLNDQEIRERTGGSEGTRLNVPDWINEVHRLFPQESIERLERDAIERYQIQEIVTSPEVLSRVQPSQTILEAVLRTRHLMNQELLSLARDLVRRVVEELMKKLATQLRQAMQGGTRARRSRPFKLSRQLDLPRTLRANLKHYDPQQRRLVLQTAYFYLRQQRHRAPWQIILLVDQSGSMVGSVIHSAITAACLYGIPSLKTHLIAFDTQIVDLTSDIDDPVELLMKVQLGGGTDICKAVAYAASLIEQPRRCILAIISDFFEGGDSAQLVRTVANLHAQGTHILGLAALDERDTPAYDRDLAQQLANAGAQIGAMTPGHLANWVAEKVLNG